MPSLASMPAIDVFPMREARNPIRTDAPKRSAVAQKRCVQDGEKVFRKTLTSSDSRTSWIVLRIDLTPSSSHDTSPATRIVTGEPRVDQFHSETAGIERHDGRLQKATVVQQVAVAWPASDFHASISLRTQRQPLPDCRPERSSESALWALACRRGTLVPSMVFQHLHRRWGQFAPTLSIAP